MKKRTRFRHLNEHDRDRIHALYGRGYSQKDVAGVLGVDPGTICRELASSTYSAAATLYNSAAPTWYLAASSTDAFGGTLTATSSGYINNPLVAAVTSSSTAPKTIAFDGGSTDTYNGSAFKFGLKVTVADQFGNAVIPVSATYLGNATTTSSGATLYWANASSTSGVLNIVRPGFINATSTNTALGQVTTASATQVVIALGNSDACPVSSPITASIGCKGLESTLKVTALNDELGNNIMPTSGTPFSVGGALNLVSQEYNNGAWYLAASSTDATGGIATSSVDGYVDEAISDILTSTTTQYTVDWGGNGSTYHGSSLPFALQVTVQNTGGVNITETTVTAGDSYDTSCVESSGNSGIYYCAIPLTDTETTAQAVKNSYVTTTGTYTDRVLSSDPQNAITIVLPLASSGGGGGSSGGGGIVVSAGGSGRTVYIAPTTTLTPTACTAGALFNIVTGAPCPAGSAGTANVALTTGATKITLPAYTKRLVKGMSIGVVSSIQTMLASDSAIYPERLVTGYFGSLTEKAIQNFQLKYGLASAADGSIFGTVGPRTYALLQEVYGAK